MGLLARDGFKRLSSGIIMLSNCRLGRRATRRGLLNSAPKTRVPGLGPLGEEEEEASGVVVEGEGLAKRSSMAWDAALREVGAGDDAAISGVVAVEGFCWAAAFLEGRGRVLEMERWADQAGANREVVVMRVKVLGRSRSSPNAREPMAMGMCGCLVGWRGLESVLICGADPQLGVDVGAGGLVVFAAHVHFDNFDIS